MSECLHVCDICVFFFFFKQKTAYEMRISDWSSDVCSSDLGIAPASCDRRRARASPSIRRRQRGGWNDRYQSRQTTSPRLWRGPSRGGHLEYNCVRRADRLRPVSRSEEHTSELQSLMRISYAVFCLKKKNNSTPTHITCHQRDNFQTKAPS